MIMDFSRFTAGSGDDGRRIDRVVRNFIQGDTLSSLYGAIRKGLIKVNGKKCTPDTRIKNGDILLIASFLLQSLPVNKNTINICNFPYPILFKNSNFLIINKPYNKNVQGTFSLAEELSPFLCDSADSSGSLSFHPGPLHRLDRMTTGVLVFSQSLEGAKWFSKNIEAHVIRKIYIGIVEGILAENRIWRNGIIEEDKNADEFHTVRVVVTETENSQEAVTQAVPLASGSYGGKPVTLVQFCIPTGRKHQIRAQAAFNRFPLLGDTAYGGTKISEDRMFYLHAALISFPENNGLGLPLQISAPVLTDFKKMLNKTLINWNGSFII